MQSQRNLGLYPITGLFNGSKRGGLLREKHEIKKQSDEARGKGDREKNMRGSRKNTLLFLLYKLWGRKKEHLA